MKEQDIYLIRHGQTAFNVEGQALSRSDIGLTNEGVEEVVRLAQHFKEFGVQPSQIYSSPMLRATNTAQLLQNHLVGVIEINEGLKEINYGIYEGKGREILREIEYGYDSQTMQKGNGETLEEIEQRVTPLIHYILETQDHSIFIVTHAFTASILAQLMMDMPRTFSNIQPLSTADYSHFRAVKGGEDKLSILTIQRNCLKGPLSI